MNTTPDALMLETARRAQRAGDLVAALANVTRALEQRASAEGWDLKGDLLLATGDAAGAVQAYRRAVDREPKNATYVHDLGRALLHTGEFKESERILNRAAQLKSSWDVLCDLGSARLELGQTEASLAALDQAVALNADTGLVQYVRGKVLLEVGRSGEAETAFREALRSMPDFPPLLMSLATLRGELGDATESEALFAKARALSPDDPSIAQAHALNRLRHGDLKEGFALYEARFTPSPFAVPTRPFAAPRWQGESLKDRDILIWTEQGLGDEILQASMFPEVIALARSVTIESSERTQPLFARCYPAAKVVARREPPSPELMRHFDFQTPAMSLARYLRTEFAAFPKQPRTLFADQGLNAAMRARYAARDRKARVVGISWDSAARHGSRKRLPLAAWQPIFEVPGITFVSLQYGVRPDAAEIKGTPLFVDPEVDAVKSLEASAAQVAAVDLVITVSNTTAHLAGAQGVPVWTLVPEGPGCFWYWFQGRDDSPWYPSMRFFRQPRPGDWSSVVEGVRTALVGLSPSGRL